MWCFLAHNRERQLEWGMDEAAPLRPCHLALLLLPLYSKDLLPHLALQANLQCYSFKPEGNQSAAQNEDTG